MLCHPYALCVGMTLFNAMIYAHFGEKMAITIAMINISHLSKSFNKQVILEDISLRIPRGEIVCLLGPSGSQLS